MQKRGQVTVFIIVGVMVLLVIGGTLFIHSYVQKKSIETEQQDLLELETKAASLQSLVDSCIEVVGTKAITTVGYRSGYADLADTHFSLEDLQTNFVYYQGEDQALSPNEMEVNLALLMNEHLQNCLPEDFSTNAVQLELNQEVVNYDLLFDGMRVETGEVETTALIADDQVLFTVHWPLTLRLKEYEQEVSDFSPAAFPVRLGKIAKYVQEFVDKLERNPYFIDVVGLLSQNVTYDLAVADDDTYLVLLTDNQSVVNYNSFQFLFASKVPSEEVLI